MDFVCTGCGIRVSMSPGSETGLEVVEPDLLRKLMDGSKCPICGGIMKAEASE